MARPEKVLAKARQGAVISFREFENLLTAFGFKVARVSGSHHIYWNDKATRPLSVQPDGKDAKRYQVRQFLAMIEEFDLKPNRP